MIENSYTVCIRDKQHRFTINETINKLVILIAILALLSGCGGGSDLENAISALDISTGGTIKGSVGDGPIVGATITIKDSNDNIVSASKSDEQANYQAILSPNATYPLTITISGGTDIVTNTAPTFSMTSAVLNQDDLVANINPFTTLIVKTAEASSGGINATNITAAKSAVLQQLNFGLDIIAFPDPITTPTTTNNTATIVRASEAVAEMIRRTKTALQIRGINLDEDDIITAISSDLTDGIIDGRGGQDADNNIAATSHVVSAKVLLETLQNQLVVDNVNVTSRLDNAIQLIEPASTYNTSDLSITADILTQIRTAINAVQVVSPSAELTELNSVLGNISANNIPDDIIYLLPANIEIKLDNAITQLATATDIMLTAINSSVRNSSTDDTSDSTNDSSPLTITNTTPSGYIWGTLAVNMTVFIDRPYFYTTIPDSFLGYKVLATSNEDKSSTGDIFISFDINQSATIYVAYDSRNHSLPSWLISWTDTGTEIIDSDTTRRIYKKVFPAGTVTLGGNNSGGANSMYTVFVKVQNSTDTSNENADTNNTGSDTSGDTTDPNSTDGDTTGDTSDTNSDQIPFANDDNVTTNQNTPINMAILTNDTGINNTPLSISILQSPSFGFAQIQSDNSITYTPNTAFAGSDAFIYKIIDSDGDIATANVSVLVECITCAADRIVTLSWDPNPGTILGYTIYYGPTLDTATTEITDINITADSFNASAPTIDFDAWNDLELHNGDTVCFRIKAYTDSVSSAFSDGICETI